jgi:GT2 family glycosyltransferase
LFVVIATAGRAALTAQTVQRLALQTRRPDGVLVVGAGPEDVAGVTALGLPVRVDLARKGSCSQRNHALDALEGDCDLLAILDDDFVAAFDFLESAEALMKARPEVVGLNGHLLADGARGPGVPFQEACRLLEAYRPDPGAGLEEQPLQTLYGCNMVLRASAIGGLRFDENLPLYGWQEDVDFTFRLRSRGRLLKSPALVGVHMGVKIGRTPGKKLGYSQIANPIYLLRKKTIPKTLAAKLLVKGPLANLIKLWRSEPYIDRRGRLTGNLMALGDLLRGRIDPRRIVDIT